MTSWQDQQPKSRRSLRESERAHAQGATSDVVDALTEDPDFGQQIWEREPQSFAADRLSQLPTEPAGPSQLLNETNKNESNGDEPLRRSRQSGTPRPEAEPTIPDPAAYRLKDFAPEARGSSFSSTQSAPWTPPLPGSQDLHYQTSVNPGRQSVDEEADEAENPSDSGVHPDVEPDPSANHTLTRRELRELRNASVPKPVPAALPVVEHSSEPVELVPPPVDSGVSHADGELAAAMAEFDRLFQKAPDSEPPAGQVGQFDQAVVPTTVPAEPKILSQEQDVSTQAAPEQAPPTQAAPEQAAPAGFDWGIPEAKTSTPALVEEAEDFAEVELVEELDDAEDVEQVQEVEPIDLVSPVERFDLIFDSEPSIEYEPMERVEPSVPIKPQEPLREVVTAPEVYSAPAGHWSTQPAPELDADSTVGPHQRDIASSDAITTSALVLPSFPVSMPTTGPVAGTGEILMTGSIALPRSLGVNGLHPSRYDRPDIDDIIDAADRENVAPDSAPVRAVRAVSTYTSSQGLINAKRPKGNNLPMVLSITAGVMMVGVVVLVVAGMIFKIF